MTKPDPQIFYSRTSNIRIKDKNIKSFSSVCLKLLLLFFHHPTLLPSTPTLCCIALVVLLTRWSVLTAQKKHTHTHTHITWLSKLIELCRCTFKTKHDMIKYSDKEIWKKVQFSFMQMYCTTEKIKWSTKINKKWTRELKNDFFKLWYQK